MENNEITYLQGKGYFVGLVDGADCNDLKSSLANIAAVFKFPDYYCGNINAFLECINDLSWLTETNYAIVIRNIDELMFGDTTDNKIYLLNMFDEISKEWANVPNYENEDAFRRKSDFKVVTVK